MKGEIKEPDVSVEPAVAYDPAMEARLLSFAARAKTTGGFGYLLADGSLDTNRPLETWITARMTHVFSLAVLSGRDDLRPLADHGVASLLGTLRDSEHGGWYTSVPGDGRKAAYDHAFVLLAGSSAVQAGLVGAHQLLDDALMVWDGRFWDPLAGAVVDAWDRRWERVEPYRGANANMHGVEAMLAAADALTGSRRTNLRKRALRVVRRFVHDEARSRSWRLPEHFDEEWVAQLEYNADQSADPFQPYGVTVGHQFEWARLAVQLDSSLGARSPAWLLEDAGALYDTAKQRGWAADGLEGFVYTLDWHDQPVVSARMHWVLAEAISAASVMLAATEQSSYAQDLACWTTLAQRRFADPSTGNWHHELTVSGHVATHTWTGQPDAYHVYQALVLQRLPVAGSLGAAIRRSILEPNARLDDCVARKDRHA